MNGSPRLELAWIVASVLVALGAGGCERCPKGQPYDPATGLCGPPAPPPPPPGCNLDCDAQPKPDGVVGQERREQGALCYCAPVECEPGWTLDEALEVCKSPDVQCPEPLVLEGFSCVYPEDVYCWEDHRIPLCIEAPCEEHPTGFDGTDLESIGKCIPGTVEIPVESCVDNCHNGIEQPHPWFGGPDLSCTGCHGGDPEATTRERAHVPIPDAWQANSPQIGRPNLRYYWNYLTLAGVERFDGGIEWLRFRNPSDLRVAEMSCGKSGCHAERVVNVQRSVMATSLGLVGYGKARNGIARTVHRNGDAVYKWDTTEGMAMGRTLEALAYDPQVTGSVEKITNFAIVDREDFGAYDQIDVLEEVYDKQCGDCHLGSAGANNRYADFRSSGCASCHMRYELSGRSSSTDQMIDKREPTYPAAYAQIANYDVNDLANQNGAWLGPERPHPARHLLTKTMAAQRCGVCHVGSNRTDWQFRGYQIDPNRTVQTALDNNVLNANQVKFTDEIDNDANPFARYHGQAQNQVLRFVDWNNDNLDDIPADIHYQAGLECMDCHTSAEMHNELKFVKVAKVSDWEDPSQVIDMSGAIWSHQDQSTEIECVHCHGNLEYRARSFELDNRNPIRNLIVCPEQDETFQDYTAPAACRDLGRGRYLLGKFSGRYHYVPQTRDTVNDVGTGTGGGPTWPSGSPVYNPNASIFHGRVNDDPSDGVGPCAAGDPQACFRDQANNADPIALGFSHLGAPAQSAVDQHEGGLECYGCHATWANMCFGCHLRLADSDGNQILRDFSRSTGELTYGQVTEADFTYISPLDMQLGINSEGKIAQFLPETKQMVAHTDADNLQFFGTQVIVNQDANIQYNVYRDRAGYGLRQYDTERVGLRPSSDGQPYEQYADMDDNAGQGAQQMMPHSVQRAHPLMDCTSCHVDLNGANADAVAARWMANPAGFGNISDYLAVLANTGIVRNNSGAQVNVDAALGFRFDANIDPDAFVVNQQSDWCVNAETGFPYCYNNHPLKLGTYGQSFDIEYLREYPTMARIAGPLGPRLLDEMFNRIRVADEGVQQKGARGR